MALSRSLARNGFFSRRLFFSLYIFAPILVTGYILPLVVYKLPIKIRVLTSVYDLGLSDILYSITVFSLWFAIAIGIILWPGRNKEKRTRKREWSPRALWKVFLLFSGLGSLTALFHYLFVMPHGFEELVHLLSFLPTLGFLLGFYVLRDGYATALHNRKKLLIFALLAVDCMVVIIVPICLGKVGPVIFSAIAIMYGVNVMRMPWRMQIFLAVILIGVVLVALPFKRYIRVVGWGGKYTRIPLIGYLSGEIKLSKQRPEKQLKKIIPFGTRKAAKKILPFSLADDMIEFTRYDPNFYNIRFLATTNDLQMLRYSLARIVHRVNHLGELAYVVRKTPEQIPYAKGITYLPLTGKLIPGLIWSNKPPENVGQFFGHRYGFLWPSDTTTSVNLPMIIEGWINGGWLGIIISAVFVGLLLRFIWFYWIGGTGAVGNTVIGMVVVMTAANQESNLSLIMGGVMHAVFVYWVFEVMIRYWSNRNKYIVQ